MSRTLSVFWGHPLCEIAHALGRWPSYYAKRGTRYTLKLSPDVDYSAKLWMFKFLNDEVEQFFDALPSLSYDLGIRSVEREDTVTRGNLDDGLGSYVIVSLGK
jgi:hypothetical protein